MATLQHFNDPVFGRMKRMDFKRIEFVSGKIPIGEMNGIVRVQSDPVESPDRPSERQVRLYVEFSRKFKDLRNEIESKIQMQFESQFGIGPLVRPWDVLKDPELRIWPQVVEENNGSELTLGYIWRKPHGASGGPKIHFHDWFCYTADEYQRACGAGLARFVNRNATRS